ncbi:hypothetical protein [Photorhabdus sp. CRCIA-P01]|uniref:hypothetical protein n=1 Tax=Photorhabdus sp. CRCIA-P01 TaxID=2019570 RepID=UPI0013007CF6|nr:hypothetical protein [Photorhabdus sp. CRCIA-P01]
MQLASGELRVWVGLAPVSVDRYMEGKTGLWGRKVRQGILGRAVKKHRENPVITD